MKKEKIAAKTSGGHIKSRICFGQVSLILLFVASVFFGKAEAQISANDWPTKGRTINRSYFVPNDLPLAADSYGGHLNLKWKRFFGERIEVEMEPLVVGDTVYIGIMNGKLYALDKNSGDIKWIFQAEGPLTDTPTLAYLNGDSNNLRIFFGSVDGKIYSLDAATGEKKWDYQTQGPIRSSPSFYSNTVFIGSLDKVFYALDAFDAPVQRVKWSYETSSPISNTSTLGETTPGSGAMGVYFANGGNYAYGFTTNGIKLWEQKMSGVYTKRTTAVYGNGVVMFVTRKPGGEYSEHLDNLPAAIQYNTPPIGRKPGDVVISAWADYYIQYPQRRTLYFFNAASGDDLWQPTIDKIKFAPLYIPYWGEYSPLIDNQGNAYLPASGSGGDHALDHDIRLWRINLATGNYVHLAGQDQFLIRFDEVGRGTLVSGKYYQTISEDVGYYDITTGQKNGSVFGNGFYSHRYPIEFEELPQGTSSATPIFGGMYKHFGRFASSGPGGFGGANDAISPLIINGDSVFVVAWGHLYALSSQQTTAIKNYMLPDLTNPPASNLTKQDVKNKLNGMVQKIVTDNIHLGPVSKGWGWNTGANATYWFEGETLRSLAETLPFIEEPLKTQFRQYLKSEVATYLLRTSPENSNLVAERMYALYKYAQMADDWQFIQDNWIAIRNLYSRWKTVGSQTHDPIYFDQEFGFWRFPRWLAGNFNPHLQMGIMLATREMAKAVGDAAIETETTSYLSQMTGKRAFVGQYVRSLYDSGQLQRKNCDQPNEWGYDMCVVPIPVEGYLDKNNDFRQVYYFDRDSSGNLIASFQNEVWDVYPYYLNGFHPFYAEFNDLIKQNLLDEITDYIKATEIVNPWWYMGDMGHQVVSTHEEDSFSPIAAVDLFQAKAYILGQSFEQLRDYLPWEFENHGYKDIYRIQNLVALLQAPESGIPVTGDVNNDTQVNVLDVQACVNHILGIQNLGARADVNGDGSVDVLDVQEIVNIILGA